MVLTNLTDKWAQDKINTAYMALENCIATTKQRETVQPFYNICYSGDLSDLSVQCPKPIRPETLWATSLCDNTVIPVGAVCSNGNIYINSSCLKTCKPTTLTFCTEARYVMWNTECEDHFITRECPTCTTYENCVWSGSNRQYNCRLEVTRLCQNIWTDTIMGLSIAKRTCCCSLDITQINECLYVCNECNGCWDLPYPCFTCCTFCNVKYYQIDDQFLIYCTPDGCKASIDEVKCIISHNPATQDCNFMCNMTIPYCYIGWNTLPYCYGGEEKCCSWNNSYWCIIVPEKPLATICRVIDVYTWTGIENDDWLKNPLYVINQNVLCYGGR